MEIDVNIPFFGSGKLLFRCLRAIGQQREGHARLRVRVFDDHSPEPADGLARQFPWVDFLRWPKNIGMVANWNRCLETGDSEFIHVLHYDDVVLPGYYNAVVPAISAYPRVGLFFTKSTGIQTARNPLLFALAWRNRLKSRKILLREPKWFLPGDGAVRKVLKGVVCSTAILARAAVEDVGGFDPEFPYSTDEEYWPRIAARWGVLFIDKPLVAYGYHGNNLHYKTWLRVDFWDQYVFLKKTRLQYLSERPAVEEREVRSKLARLAVGISMRLLARGHLEVSALYLERARQQHPPVVETRAYRLAERLRSLGVLGQVFARVFND